MAPRHNEVPTNEVPTKELEMTAKKERMSPGFAVFNEHINNARERADAEFTKQFGKEQFDKEIQPLHEAGIMSIFNEPPTSYRMAWVTLVTAYVNEAETGTEHQDLSEAHEESGGKKYALGWKAGWAAAMAQIRDEAMRQMFEPPAPEPRLNAEQI